MDLPVSNLKKHKNKTYNTYFIVKFGGKYYELAGRSSWALNSNTQKNSIIFIKIPDKISKWTIVLTANSFWQRMVYQSN